MDASSRSSKNPRSTCSQGNTATGQAEKDEAGHDVTVLDLSESMLEVGKKRGQTFESRKSERHYASGR